MSVEALFTIIKYESNLSAHKRIKKTMCVCVYTYINIFIYTLEYYSSHKNELNYALYKTWIDLGGSYINSNKSEKDKHCMSSLLCGI